jgi:hypothetical protein
MRGISWLGENQLASEEAWSKQAKQSKQASTKFAYATQILTTRNNTYYYYYLHVIN